MGETRRHSVDVPITRTLVALRRVRSLRDPCTNSMSKFPSFLENVKWETGSNNGISLQFLNDDSCQVDDVSFKSYSIMEELEKGCDLHKLSNTVLNTEAEAFSISKSPSSERSCGAEDAASGGRYRTHCSTNLASSVGESNVVTPSHETVSQKFRPKSFDELLGQEVVVKCLLSTILRGRITSVYLFHGPRGTGKTSASKIFAAALNCLSQAAHSRPCGLCSECRGSTVVKEIDSVKLNRPSYLRALIRSASLPPVSSRFKAFIIDECQLLCQETWCSLLNSLDSFSHRSVFILVTSEVEKLPRNVLSRSQKYHFSKVCDAEISSKLVKICVEEGIDFDQGAVDFIASKSDGSVLDAEIMLDQLSLLGKRITTSLAYKLVS